MNKHSIQMAIRKQNIFTVQLYLYYIKADIKLHSLMRNILLGTIRKTPEYVLLIMFGQAMVLSS